MASRKSRRKPFRETFLENRFKFSTTMKYLISGIFSFLVFNSSQNLALLGVTILELLIIFLISNLIVSRYKIFGNIFNFIVIFLFNVEQGIYIFGGTYLSSVMISNLGSLSALSGKIWAYSLAILGVILVSIIPIQKVDLQKKYTFAILVLLLTNEASLISGMDEEERTSPFFNFYNLYQEKLENDRIAEQIASMPDVTKEFFKTGVTNHIEKPAELKNKPNVILIFTEGLSQSVIDSDKNIMPNVKKVQQESINFTNYYNHTFATYRGLIGQLYSGYQFDNYDSNHLISIQSILKNEGYTTSFINSEPANETFTNYLESFGFDHLTSLKNGREGQSDTVSDKQMYKLLFEEAESNSQSNKPFFISMYTFGTHVSMDSVNQKFGDGKNASLNKYYDLDYQFGEFLKDFNNSALSENTILVFTTDHATYVDDSYQSNFTDRVHGSLDQIPFFIYSKKLRPSSIDAKARNSLDMAPTLLDFLDISAPNYFLGESLFADKASSVLETTYNSENNYLSTESGQISTLKDGNKEQVVKKIEKYFAANQQEPIK